MISNPSIYSGVFYLERPSWSMISTGIFASHESWTWFVVNCCEFFTFDLISIGNLMASWWPSHITKLHEYFTIQVAAVNTNNSSSRPVSSHTNRTNDSQASMNQYSLTPLSIEAIMNLEILRRFAARFEVWGFEHKNSRVKLPSNTVGAWAGPRFESRQQFSNSEGCFVNGCTEDLTPL